MAYDIPLANATNVPLQTQTPMGGDTRLPLSVQPFQPIDTVGQESKAYDLAAQEGAYNDAQQKRDREQQDRQTFDMYLKSGGDVATPDGLDKAAKELKGKLSPDAYERLLGIADKKKKTELDYRDSLNAASLDDLKVGTTKSEEALKLLRGPLEAYDAAKQTNPDEANAQQAFEANKQATIQMLSQQVGSDGKPMYPPDMLKQFQQMTPDQLKHRIEDTAWKHKLMTEEVETKLKTAQTAAANAAAKLKDAQADDIPEKDRLAQERIDKMLAKGQLDAGDAASLVQGIASYKLPPLSSFAMRSPQGMAIMSKVLETTPDYDAKKYKAMQGTLDSVLYGANSKVITAYKTANYHLSALEDTVKELNNGDNNTLNRFANAFATEFNLSTAPTDFNAMKQAIAAEINKTFSGGGAGALADRQELEASLSTARSPEELKSVMQHFRQLLQGKMQATEESVKAGLKGEVDFSLHGKPPQDATKDPKAAQERADIAAQELAAEQANLAALPATATPTQRQAQQDLVASAQRNYDAVTKGPKKDIAVKTHDGQVFHFPTQAAADAFSKAAGIQ